MQAFIPSCQKMPCSLTEIRHDLTTSPKLSITPRVQIVLVENGSNEMVGGTMTKKF
jgi:hypothetical protein